MAAVAAVAAVAVVAAVAGVAAVIVAIVVVLVGVVVVVVWDAVQCVCMYSPHRASNQVPSKFSACRPGDVGLCCPKASANPCSVMSRNETLIPLINTS